MIYKRYEFNSEEQAQDKMDAFYTMDDEGNKQIEKGVWFKPLAYIELEKGQYDSEGLEITPPIMSTKYAVDAQWRFLDESPYGWKSYEVNPGNPYHKLM